MCKTRDGCTTCVREFTVQKCATVLCTVLGVNSRVPWCLSCGAAYVCLVSCACTLFGDGGFCVRSSHNHSAVVVARLPTLRETRMHIPTRHTSSSVWVSGDGSRTKLLTIPLGTSTVQNLPPWTWCRQSADDFFSTEVSGNSTVEGQYDKTPHDKMKPDTVHIWPISIPRLRDLKTCLLEHSSWIFEVMNKKRGQRLPWIGIPTSHEAEPPTIQLTRIH